ncbi:MAG: SAM-dependent methyltransferase [Halieaceae bacterium]
MRTASRQVRSNQQHTHPGLPELLRRHMQARWQKPVADFNSEAFDAINASIAEQNRPLILDSFCGTGLSTAQLAARHPDHLVVGIDQSAQRLSRHSHSQDNYLLLRAECEPLWLLLVEAGITLSHHYLLYPNPWPKRSHLKRRIHGHPAFPLLLALGGSIELRTNWQIYAEEFGLALHLAGTPGYVSQFVMQGSALTLFEQKYADSGHPLWRYRGDVRPTGM